MQKEMKRDEPKVTKKKIIASAFITLEKNQNIEILDLCQVYVPVIRRLVNESKDKIKELTNWK